MEDVPIGFLFSLAANNIAFKYYADLPNKTKDKITKYIQTPNDMETKERIKFVVDSLEKKNISFL